MKTTTSQNKIEFGNLLSLFRKRNAGLFNLNKLHGKGYVQILKLEKGLQVRFWNFCFYRETEIYNDPHCTEDGSNYFTLAFFLNTHGLQFAHDNVFFKKSTVWDTIFMSNTSNFRITISPLSRGYCLAVSFSKQWLFHTLLNNEEAKNLKLMTETPNSFLVREFMNEDDKRQVKELMDITWKKALGTFYIKSYVLKLVSNFFNRIKDRNVNGSEMVALEFCISKVEEYLANHIQNPLPDLKHLAERFSINERTLMRRFIQQHGVNVSTYFFSRKMEYAKELMEKQKLQVNKVALLLGYKNVSNFKRMFRKYSSAI